MRMTASNELLCFLVWPLPEAMGILRNNCPVGALYHHSMNKHGPGTLYDHSLQGSPPRTNDLTRTPVMATAKKRKGTTLWLSSLLL